MILLKQASLFLLVTLLSTVAVAQATGDTVSRKNLIKINVPALLFKNISFQYERKLSSKSSLAVGIRYRPVSSLPFQNVLTDIIDDPSIKVQLSSIGNFGITPEYRFYLSKKGDMRGFYIGPTIGFNYYNGTVPVNYSDYVNNTSIEKTAVFKGHTTAITAGFQIGAQWKLGERLYLDWWILGPNYGFSNGDFKFTGALNDIEQISMQFELEKIQQTIPFIKVEVPDKPTAAGAAFKVNGPWAGVRAFGLNLGYRF